MLLQDKIHHFALSPQPDQNVTFGNPLHRGCEGGEQCSVAFALLSQAMSREFRGHDILIQALAAHYHLLQCIRS
jgi:hypothetical protein